MTVINIIFVDKDDNVIGAGSQQEAYDKGIIHRVVRIFLFNSKGELLLQKRADHMKTNPGMWADSAAGHVDEGETYLAAAQRETEEELGIQDVVLKEMKKTYVEETDKYKRKRFTMLYSATYDGEVHPNPEEVSQVKWIMPEALRTEIRARPSQFSEGFRLAFTAL